MQIKCEECGKTTESSEWIEGEAWEGHPAIVCPLCEIGKIDLVTEYLEHYEAEGTQYGD